MQLAKLAAAAVLAIAFSAGAQAPKEPTANELKAQLAEANLEIAQLKQQILELQITVQLAERAALPQVDQARQQAAQELQGRKDAATMTRAAAEAEKAQNKPKEKDK